MEHVKRNLKLGRSQSLNCSRPNIRKRVYTPGNSGNYEGIPQIRFLHHRARIISNPSDDELSPSSDVDLDKNDSLFTNSDLWPRERGMTCPAVPAASTYQQDLMVDVSSLSSSYLKQWQIFLHLHEMRSNI